MREGALPGADPDVTAAFWQRCAKLQRSVSAASLALEKALKKIETMKIALLRTPAALGNIDQQWHQVRDALLALDERMNGNRSKRQVGETRNTTIENRLNFAMAGTWYSTYGPTPTHKRSLEIAETQFGAFKTELEKVLDQQLPELEKILRDAGAPWVEDQLIPED